MTTTSQARKKIMAILRQATGTLDEDTRSRLKRMDADQVATCARVALLAKDRALVEVAYRADRARGKGRSRGARR